MATLRIPGSFFAGLLRVLSSGRLLLLIYCINVAATLIPALVLFDAIEESVATSARAEELRTGFSDEWFREFSAEAKGIAKTFSPTVTGIGALFNGIDAWLDGTIWSQFSGLLGIGILYMLVWTLLAPGAIRHLAGDQRFSLPQLLSDGGRFAGRFLALLLIGLLLYGILYRGLLPMLDGFVQDMNRNTIDERVAFGWTCLKYVLFLFALMAVNIVLDYARILTAMEDRRSIVGILLGSLRFVWRNCLSVFGLYLCLGLVSLGAVALYWVVAPGSGESSWMGILFAFVLGQAYILLRIGIRLWFLASQAQLAIIARADY